MKVSKKLLLENPDKKIREVFPELFKIKLEVGFWYNSGKCLFNYQKGINVYGFDKLGWVNSSWTWDDTPAKPATHQEVFEALKKEALKKYSGKSFTPIGLDKKIEFQDVDFEYFLELGVIYSDGYEIFNKGIWAEIIETITKEEAEKILNKKII